LPYPCQKIILKYFNKLIFVLQKVLSLIYQNRKIMTTLNTQIENLTKSQLADFTILVRLGDSKELALKTVLEMNDNTTTELYELAYNS
jgi:hypothetical protein